MQQGSERLRQPIDEREWADIATTRSRVYGFLGAIYNRLPDERFVNGLFGQETTGFIDGMSKSEDLPEEMREGATMIGTFVSENAGTPVDDLKTRINVERTRLLRGVKPGYGPLPPYESIYANEQRELDVFPLADVVGFYADEEVSVPAENREQADYIGLELDFMRHLCAREGQAWIEGDRDRALELIDKERAFLNDHANAWIPAFCDEMIKDAHLGLYQGVARITRGFVADETRQSDEYRDLAALS